MKNTVTGISVTQMVVLLLLNRIVINLAYSDVFADISKMWYGFYSTIGAFFITIVMLIPVYLLHKDDKNLNVVDNSYLLFGKAGMIIAFIYIFYFIWELVYNLALFDVFVSDIMSPNISGVTLSVIITLASIYGAWKGIEALSRTSTVIMFFLLIAVFFFSFSLLPNVDNYNFLPLTKDEMPTVWQEITAMVARNACIPCMALLLPLVRGNVKKGMVFWALFTYGSLAVLIMVTVGVLGPYISTQVFPVYVLASVGQLGVFERLDGLFLGAWAAGIFIKMSLFIYLVGVCMKRAFGDFVSRVSILACGAFVFIFGTLVPLFVSYENIIFNETILLCLTLTTAVIIPLLLLIVRKIKFKKQKRSQPA